MLLHQVQGKIEADGHLRLDLSLDLPAGTVVDVTVNGEANRTSAGKYDFSDVVGKLVWNGDALAEQRKLRDEW